MTLTPDSWPDPDYFSSVLLVSSMSLLVAGSGPSESKPSKKSKTPVFRVDCGPSGWTCGLDGVAILRPSQRSRMRKRDSPGPGGDHAIYVSLHPQRGIDLVKELECELFDLFLT